MGILGRTPGDASSSALIQTFLWPFAHSIPLLKMLFHTKSVWKAIYCLEIQLKCLFSYGTFSAGLIAKHTCASSCHVHCPSESYCSPYTHTHTHTHTCTHARVQSVAPDRTTCIPLNGVKLWTVNCLQANKLAPLAWMLAEDQGSIFFSFSSLSFCFFFFLTVCLQLL